MGGTACVAEQQEAAVHKLNFHGILASGGEFSLRLLVPATHSLSVEVPPRGVSPMTTDFVDSNGRHDLSQNAALKVSRSTKGGTQH
jgi:hypothetical protein